MYYSNLHHQSTLRDGLIMVLILLIIFFIGFLVIYILLAVFYPNSLYCPNYCVDDKLADAYIQMTQPKSKKGNENSQKSLQLSIGRDLIDRNCPNYMINVKYPHLTAILEYLYEDEIIDSNSEMIPLCVGVIIKDYLVLVTFKCIADNLENFIINNFAVRFGSDKWSSNGYLTRIYQIHEDNTKRLAILELEKYNNWIHQKPQCWITINIYKDGLYDYIGANPELNYITYLWRYNLSLPWYERFKYHDIEPVNLTLVRCGKDNVFVCGWPKYITQCHYQLEAPLFINGENHVELIGWRMKTICQNGKRIEYYMDFQDFYDWFSSFEINSQIITNFNN